MMRFHLILLHLHLNCGYSYISSVSMGIYGKRQQQQTWLCTIIITNCLPSGSGRVYCDLTCIVALSLHNLYWDKKRLHNFRSHSPPMKRKMQSLCGSYLNRVNLLSNPGLLDSTRILADLSRVFADKRSRRRRCSRFLW